MKKFSLLIIAVSLFACSNLSSDSSNNETQEQSTTSNSLSGLYKSKANGIYSAFEFKGKSTVVITSLGMQFPTEYVRDENFIRVKTDKSDLLLEVKSDLLLVGEGFAEGEYVKE